jgi:hypothetical protein
MLGKHVQITSTVLSGPGQRNTYRARKYLLTINHYLVLLLVKHYVDFSSNSVVVMAPGDATSKMIDIRSRGSDSNKLLLKIPLAHKNTIATV